MNESATPAGWLAQEDEGRKVQCNLSRGIRQSLGVLPQNPLNFLGEKAWLMNLFGKIEK
jgi:hypothetical protein